MAERLRSFIENTGLKDGEFGRKFSALPQEISNWTHGKKISIGKMSNMFEAYPELNAHWIITGEGNMLIAKGDNNEEPQTVYISPECRAIVDKLNDENKELTSLVIELQKEKIDWLNSRSK